MFECYIPLSYMRFKPSSILSMCTHIFIHIYHIRICNALLFSLNEKRTVTLAIFSVPDMFSFFYTPKYSVSGAKKTTTTKAF